MMSRFFSFFLILIFLIYGNSSMNGKQISIDLVRMPSPLKVLMANHHLKEYRPIFDHLKRLKLSSTSNETVPLFKFLDYEFYGEVLIGHPGQKFRVVFDTAWADLWVPSIRCPITNIACAVRNKYNHNKSSFYKYTGKKFNINYSGKYNLSGDISMDLVHLGGMNITNQTFGEIDTIPWKEFLLSKADGVFGLSFDTNAMDGITPFFYNMVNQKRISNAMFSIYLNRDHSTVKGGAILFGGVDSRHFRGNFTYVPVDPKTGLWQFEAEGITIAGVKSTFCNGGCSVIADTSANEIKGPQREIEAINDAIQARAFHFNRYVVDCGTISKLPKITIKIGGKDFVLKGPQYIQVMSYGPATLCMSSFSINPFAEQFNWTLGGAFLSRYYSVYNLEKYTIGFADAL